jgi:hypothetical protein
MAVRLAVDMNLFDAIAEASRSAERPFNVQDLCDETALDPLLVGKLRCIGPFSLSWRVFTVTGRIIRFLAAMGVIKQVDCNSYTQTPLAAAYVSNSPLSAAVIHR